MFFGVLTSKSSVCGTDPKFELKGAARAAQEFYRPPGYEALPEPRDLLTEYRGRMWEIKEGRELLLSLVDLGVAFHNIGSKAKDAMKTFQEALDLDTSDHLVRKVYLSCSEEELQAN